MPSIPQFPSENAPFLDWALSYASRSWAVLPCRGKKPLVQGGWRAATTDQAQWRAWAAQWEGALVNLGWAMTPYQFGLDVDPRNGGPETLYQLERTYGALPATLTNLTGNGGEHRIFCSPVPILHKAFIGDGIDIIAEGGYLLVPNSVHPETGRPYRWEVQYGPEDREPAEAPQWLLDLIAQDARGGGGPGRHNGKVWLPEASEPIPQGMRNEALFHLALRRRLDGRDEATIVETVWQDNMRCEPPLPEKELYAIVKSVLHYQPLPRLLIGGPEPPTEPLETLTIEPGPYLADGSIVKKELQAPYNTTLEPFTNKLGAVQANSTTVSLILRDHSAWAGRFWWDDFQGAIMEEGALGSFRVDGTRLTTIGAALGGPAHKVGIASDRLLERCLHAIAHTSRRDSLAEYVDTLPVWDREARLETWLVALAGTEDDPYTRYCSRMLPLCLVDRAFHPGGPYRTVIILEGRQGWHKSELVWALAPLPAWHLALTYGFDHKEAEAIIGAKWVVELPELQAMLRSTSAGIKAFITKRVGSYQKKYANDVTESPRRCVFVGTTNDAIYLQEAEDQERFFPVRLTQDLDITAFLEYRDQLYAEAAAYLVKHPHDWWVMSAEVRKIAAEVRELRTRENPWLETIRTFLLKDAEGELTTTLRPTCKLNDIIQRAIGAQNPTDLSSDKIRKDAVEALRLLGYNNKKINGARVWSQL